MSRAVALPLLLVALATALPVRAAPGNEAVQIVDGRRVVKLREYPQAYRVQHRRWESLGYAFNDDLRRSMSSMMETPAGIKECLMPFYDDKFCQPSTLGTVKKPRRWVVLREGTWYTCKRPDSPRRDCAGPSDTYSVYEEQ